MPQLMKTLLSVGIVLATTSVTIAGEPPKAFELFATAEPLPIRYDTAEYSINLSVLCTQQKLRSSVPSDLYRPAATDTVHVNALTLKSAQASLNEKGLTFRSE
jgi:hypothetical protein